MQISAEVIHDDSGLASADYRRFGRGLFAAHLLRRLGWDVAVYERTTSDLASRGAAIGFTEERENGPR